MRWYGETLYSDERVLWNNEHHLEKREDGKWDEEKREKSERVWWGERVCQGFSTGVTLLQLCARRIPRWSLANTNIDVIKLSLVCLLHFYFFIYLFIFPLIYIWFVSVVELGGGAKNLIKTQNMEVFWDDLQLCFNSLSYSSSVCMYLCISNTYF